MITICSLLLVTTTLAERWGLSNKLQVVRDHLEQFHTFAEFNNTANTTGWSFLKITTTNSDTDQQQFYYAGFLEGYLTKDLIYDAYRNYVATVLNGNADLPEGAQIFINKQIKWMKEMSKQEGSVWGQVSNLLAQLEGMYAGYSLRVEEDHNKLQYLDFDHFYYLTNMGDLEDILPSVDSSFQRPPDCNSLVKLTKEGKIIVGHNTFNIYSLMLRIYKTYNFALHDRNVQTNLSFSSRPGDLESKDDFYFLFGSKMIVVETSLNNWNKDNYKYLHPESLPTWVRVNIASRLSKDGKEWAKIFETDRSGTHNNQWFIVDFKNQFSEIIYLVEESFYLYKVQDITQELLRKNGYAGSFNVAYNEEIYQAANYKQGYGKTYWTDPRSIQFGKFQSDITDVFTMGRVIRSNLNTSFDICNEAISPRCDLQAKFTFGGIDGKVVDLDLLLQNKVMIISSPTYQTLEPFNWNRFENVAHYGMTDNWKFPWYIYDQEKFQLIKLYYEDA